MSAAGLLLAALAGGGCREAPRAVVLDLAADAHLARQVHPEGVRSFVAPPATVYAGGQRASRRGAEPRLVSTVFLEWPDARPREVWLDIERPGWGTGDVAVRLNRTPLEPLRLEPGRREYAVALPPGAQQAGPNRLRLTFRGAGDGVPLPPAGGRARIQGVSLRRPGTPGEPRSVAAGDEAGPVLAQGAGTRLEYALRIPEAVELRFTPRLRAGEAAVFRVELTVEGEPARESFRREVRAGERPREVRVPLPGDVGRPALLVLEVDSDSGGAVGEWVAPRVLGREDPAAETRVGETPGPALRDLRRRLRDTGVLLIVLDAAAAGHLGCYGYPRDTTPEIDRIAAHGVVFDRAYTPASYTTLAMASLWTAQHPEQHHHGRRPAGALPEGRVVLPELLEEQGTRVTAFVGNPNAGRLAGLARGFAAVEPLRLASKGPGPGDDGRSSLEQIAAALVARGPGPSLTYLHYLEPHFPYDPPPPFDTRFGVAEHLPADASTDPSWFHSVNLGRVRPSTEEIGHLVRLYDGNLAAVDDEVGRLRRRLEAAGRWDDLLVIVTADHGEAFGEHGLLTHAAQVYEESVRIPLIVKLPGETPSRRYGVPVDLIDLGATLADVFGVGAGDAFQGRSLLPLLAGEPLAPRAIVTRNASERPTYGLVDGDLKLIHDPRLGMTELFDLGTDPGETEDLSTERGVTAELLRQSLYRWLRDLDRGPPATGAEPTLSPEDQAALRALGYLN